MQRIDGFDVSAESAAWMVTSYLIGSTISIAVVGRIGDLFGHRAVIARTDVIPASGFRAAFAVATGAAVVGLVCACATARRDAPARRYVG